MWVEYDPSALIREFDDMSSQAHTVHKPEKAAQRAGLLFYKDEPNAPCPRWLCHKFNDYRNVAANQDGFEPIDLARITYVFDPEGDPMRPVRGSTFWNVPTLSLIPGFPKLRQPVDTGSGVIRDMEYDPEFLLCGFQVEKAGIMPMDWFVSRGAAIVDPWWVPHLTKWQQGKRPGDVEHYHESRRPALGRRIRAGLGYHFENRDLPHQPPRSLSHRRGRGAAVRGEQNVVTPFCIDPQRPSRILTAEGELVAVAVSPGMAEAIVGVLNASKVVKDILRAHLDEAGDSPEILH
jgi:hypothetical protein